MFYCDTTQVAHLFGVVTLGAIQKPPCQDSVYWGLISDLYTDMAYHKDSVLYVYAQRLFSPTNPIGLKAIDLNAVTARPQNVDIGDHINALTSDVNGLVYMAGNREVHVFDPRDSSLTMIGLLPPTMHSFGDLTFRHGKLLLNTAEEQLVMVDIQRPENSKVLFDLEEEIPPIYGMGTVNISCDSVETYAMGYDSLQRAMYRLNFSEKRLEKVCDTELTIFGLASVSEVKDLACAIQIDLDSEEISTIDYVSDPDCPSSAQLVNRPVISSDLTRIDSMKVRFKSGMSDPAYERIVVESTVIGLDAKEDADCVLFTNKGNASVLDFQAQLEELYYLNLNPEGATTGQRLFEFTIYSDLVEGDMSYTYLNVVSEDDISYQYEVHNLSCEGEEDGQITISNVEGGQAPYTYSINGTDFSNQTDYDNLPAGLYTISIQDNGDCRKWREVELIQPTPGLFDLGPNLVIEDGESVTLSISTDIVDFGYLEWTSPSSINCSMCLELEVIPSESTSYVVEAEDNLGCTYLDSVYVEVHKTYDIYAPNVFSPNYDGINDHFYLFSKDRHEIEEFYVFGRNGWVYFESTTAITNHNLLGWDGTIGNEEAPQGVYMWKARVRLPDGIKELAGDVTLLR